MAKKKYHVISSVFAHSKNYLKDLILKSSKKMVHLQKQFTGNPKNLTIAIPKNTDFIPLAMYGVPVVKKKER